MEEKYKHLEFKDEVFNSTPKSLQGNANRYAQGRETSFEILDEIKINSISNSKEEFFTKLNITLEKYKFIIAACCDVAGVNSEILIFLNISNKEKYKYILGFLLYLKIGLPTDVMKFLCFTVEDEKIIITKNNLIDQDENSRERSVDSKSTFLFNFISEKFKIYNLKIEFHMYLDFIWENLDFNNKLDKFRHMAQILVEDKFILDEYDRICTLFSINENRKLLTESERIEALKYIYNNVINSKDLIKNKCYCELFVNILKVELEYKKLKRQKYLPSSHMIEVILNFYDLVEIYFHETEGEEIKKIINCYILISIIDGKEAGKLVYISNIFLNANTKIAMFRNLIDNMFVHEQFVDEILKWYILKRFAEINDLDKFLEEIRFWGNISVKLIDMDFFAEHVENKLLNMLREEYNKLPICIKIYNFLDDFRNLDDTGGDKYRYTKFSDRLRNHIYAYMIDVIDMAKITYKDLMSIEIKNINKENNKYKAIYYIQRLLKEDENTDIREIEMYICSLDKYVMINLTQLIREHYKENLNQQDFRKIMAGFIDQAVYANNIVLYNFCDLFKFIKDNRGTEEVRKYIIWVADNFKEIKNPMHLSRLKNGLWLYVEKYDTTFFKDKAGNKLFLEIKDEDIKAILKHVKIKSSPGLKGIIAKLSKSHNKI
ncbi:MAG: hypothetical protein ABF633_13450 [Clostridium sp.]|uniref:hypothetical protein n=1 Tax=Clostridium sp. TaxID=1506 RepID=UPI0039EA11E6